MTACLTDEQLERLAQGRTWFGTAWLGRRHLNACPLCATRWQELADDRELIAELRQALDPPAAPAAHE